MISIENSREEHYDKILNLNEQLVHFLSPMDLNKYQKMIQETAMNKVALEDDEVTGFMMVFSEGKSYDSVNYKWFEQRYEKFLYVDRIVISPKHHKKGIGKKLYEELFSYAKKIGYNIITCEIDIEPPNPGSLKFHNRMGFQEVGTQEIDSKGSKKVVSLQIAEL